VNATTRLSPISLLLSLLLAADSQGETEVIPDSVSLGHPNDGRLQGGHRLPERALGLRSLPSPRGGNPKHGTAELVRALVKIGADMEGWAPGATLYVGDLSARGGGPLAGHESHQAGRDADLLFYALDQHGRVARPRGVRFDGSGRQTGGDLAFDARRNWLVLRSLIENREAHLQRVLVSEPLRALMLDHARSAGEPPWVIERAGEVMCDSWSPHDDHFHIRLFCTAEDYRLGCRDEHPLYPWRRTELAALGVPNAEVEEDPNRSRSRARRWLAGRAGVRQWCP
jgi:penicillin-insensitive murein endopeptidase